MSESIIVGVLVVVITNIITFHITRVKDKKRERIIVDKNIKRIIEHQNVIVRALANSNGFGEKFNAAYKAEQEMIHNDLRLDKEVD